MKLKKEPPISPPMRKELSNTPVRMCNEISRLFRSELRGEGQSEGVMSQHGAYLVLSVLAVNDGINQLEVVRATHLRPPTVSVILKRMEEEGIVERKPNPEDMRSLNVYLTETGRRLDREKIESIKKIEAVALEGLDDADTAILMELLSRIRDNLLEERKGGESE